MDLQYFGANCLVLTTAGNRVRVVIDDNLDDLGAKSVAKPGDIALFTGPHGIPNVETKLTIDGPGEYEVSDVSVYGIPARAHIGEPGTKLATMYKLITKEVSVLVTGHIYPELSDEQLESIGMIDVMCVPVGGNGYTLDPVGALKLIKAVEPKLVIPTHYDTAGINYPVPQQELQSALREMALEPRDTTETTTKLKLKAADLPEVMQLVVLGKA